MPLYDFRCKNESCGLAFEHYLPLDRYKECPPCEKCAGETERLYLPTGSHLSSNPVIVFKAPDGTYRYPGDPNGISAHDYAKKGFERIELRNWADVRGFEKHINKREAAQLQRKFEQQQQYREERQSAMRKELNHVMNHGQTIRDPDGRVRTMAPMSERGRAVARAAMEQNNRREHKRPSDVGFHVEAYSYDRSNREASRDERGWRRRD